MLKRKSLAACAALAVALTVGPGVVSAAGAAEVEGVHLVAHLSGLNETPAAGDSDGSGGAHLDVTWGKVCWEIGAEAIATPTAAHIHAAAIGAAGPVVVDFQGKLEGCTAVAPDLTVALATNPQGYYVNLHNGDFPGGAVRGQLNWFPLGPGAQFRAKLLGTNELAGSGDPDATGQMIFLLRGTVLCWKAETANVAPITARHIHNAAADANGPIVADFGAQAAGCRDIPEALLAGLVANTSNYYGNVHNADFRAGAARGQLVFEQITNATPRELR